MEASIDWLRKQGIAKAAGKANRTTSEGAISLAISGEEGSITEINCETDFVARNEQFIVSVSKIADIALKQGGKMDNTLNAKYSDEVGSVRDQLSTLTSTLGENMTFRRCDVLTAAGGFVTSYVHNAASDNVGQLGVLVAVKTDKPDNDAIRNVARQVAMHVAAANPRQ